VGRQGVEAVVGRKGAGRADGRGGGWEGLVLFGLGLVKGYAPGFRARGSRDDFQFG